MADLQATVLLRHLRQLVTADSSGPLPDRHLLQRFARDGDEAAFAALLRRHGPMVLGVCRRVLHHQHDAEDAFQATFFVLARKAGSIRRQDSLSSWLYQVAYRTAVKARAAAAQRLTAERGEGTMQPADPLAEVTWRELRGVLDEELHRLPDRYSAPLVLCYLQGQTQDQAARHLGWTKSTFRRRLEVGRQRLRLRLARRGVTLCAAFSATLLTEAAAPAAVPAGLMQTTLQGATQVAAGTAATSSVISSPVAALTEGVLKAMYATRLKITTLVLLAAGAFALTAALWAHQTLAQPPGEEKAQTKPAAAPTKASAAPVKKTKSSDSKELAITGRVTTPDGKAAAGARVAVLLWSHQRPQLGQTIPGPETLGQVKADAEGKYRLRVKRPAPIQYFRQRQYQLAVVAAANGYGLAFQCLPLDADKPEAQITLPKEQVRRGRLIDLQGQPVAGARLEVVRVGVRAPGYHYFVGSDEDESIETYAGTLPFNSSGGRIMLWEQEIMLFEAPQGLPPWPGPVTTDARGRFTLRGIGPNQPVGLHVRAKGDVAFQKVEFQARKEERPPEVTFSLDTACLIEGTVTDAQTGKPLPKAHVHIQTASSASFRPPWQVPADWRGRRGLVGQGYGPAALPVYGVPGVTGQTDAKGRFRLNPYLGTSFTVLVSAPDGEPYQAVKTTLKWPKGAIKQTVAVALPRGAYVRGKVVESPSGKPVAGARIDFWYKGIPKPKNFFTEPPDGTFYPGPLKADGRGEFQLVVPPGPCHLLFNGPGPNYVFQKIATADLGVKQPEGLGLAMSAGKRAGKKHYYYPDGWLSLNYKAGAKPDALKVTLRRAPVVKGRLVDPDGKPVAKAQIFAGQEPFAELAHGYFARKYEVKEGRFELAVRNPEAPLCVTFFEPGKGLGAVAAFTRKGADKGPVTVRLRPCSSATARFVDAKGKPLAGYRPLLWLSVSPAPYSSAKELETLGTDQLYSTYDTVWMGRVDPRRYGDGPKTDAAGQITFLSLIPGETYRIARLDGTDKTFKAEAGKTVNLGDVAIKDPAGTKKLPVVRNSK
jgi:RNA polymerase sigma factor (sigma-70 family)